MKKIAVDSILSQHDEFMQNPELKTAADKQIAMTTLVYYYYLDSQHNNLFQLLNDTKNMEL